MKEYEVVSECIIGGERVQPGTRVKLSDAQAKWARSARVIADEPVKQPAPKKAKK